MNKTFFMIALASVLTIGGLTAYADNFTPQSKVSFDKEMGVLSSKGFGSLSMTPSDAIGLSRFLSTTDTTASGENESGYMQNDGSDSKFVSLAGILKGLDVEKTSISLGKFTKDSAIQLGKNGANFSSVKVESDAGFHGGYDIDSFFHLDFSEDPFDGRIEILVAGEPRPPSTVTLLVALVTTGAGLLFFRSRRKQHALCITQA